MRETAAKRRCGKVSKSFGQSNEQFRAAISRLCSLLLGKSAEKRDLEHLSLESLYDRNQPEYDRTEADYRGDEHNEEWSKHGNDKEDQSGQFQSEREQDGGTPKREALEGMEAHEAIVFVRLEKQVGNRGDESKVGERSGDGLGQNTDLALRARLGLYGAAATGTIGSGLWHLRSADRARGKGNVRLIHCRDHIKMGSGRQMGRLYLTN